MIRFALGLLAPYICVIAWDGFQRGNAIFRGWFWLAWLAPAICYGVAVLSACLIALLVNYRFPKRVFARGRAASFGPVFAGLIISALTILVAIPVVVFGSAYGPDWALLSVSTLLPTLGVLFFCRRAVPGTCRDCGFDVRASLDMGRCPECGRVFA